MLENQPDSSEPLLIRAIEKVNPWLLAVAFHAALIGVAEVAARMDVGDILPRQSPLTDRGTSAESGKSFEYSQKPLEELKKSRATFVEACIRHYFSPGVTLAESEKPSLDTFLYADALDTVEMELRHGRTASLSEAQQVSRQLWDSRVDRLLEVPGTWTGDLHKDLSSLQDFTLRNLGENFFGYLEVYHSNQPFYPLATQIQSGVVADQTSYIVPYLLEDIYEARDLNKEGLSNLYTIRWSDHTAAALVEERGVTQFHYFKPNPWNTGETSPFTGEEGKVLPWSAYLATRLLEYPDLTSLQRREIQEFLGPNMARYYPDGRTEERLEKLFPGPEVRSEEEWKAGPYQTMSSATHYLLPELSEGTTLVELPPWLRSSRLFDFLFPPSKTITIEGVDDEEVAKIAHHYSNLFMHFDDHSLTPIALLGTDAQRSRLAQAFTPYAAAYCDHFEKINTNQKTSEEFPYMGSPIIDYPIHMLHACAHQPDFRDRWERHVQSLDPKGSMAVHLKYWTKRVLVEQEGLSFPGLDLSDTFDTWGEEEAVDFFRVGYQRSQDNMSVFQNGRYVLWEPFEHVVAEVLAHNEKLSPEAKEEILRWYLVISGEDYPPLRNFYAALGPHIPREFWAGDRIPSRFNLPTRRATPAEGITVGHSLFQFSPEVVRAIYEVGSAYEEFHGYNFMNRYAGTSQVRLTKEDVAEALQAFGKRSWDDGSFELLTCGLDPSPAFKEEIRQLYFTSSPAERRQILIAAMTLTQRMLVREDELFPEDRLIFFREATKNPNSIQNGWLFVNEVHPFGLDSHYFLENDPDRLVPSAGWSG